jgi:hypothetical protein
MKSPKDLAARKHKPSQAGRQKATVRIGASEGIRTLDIHLGKVTLYQTELRSHPIGREQATGTSKDCKPRFEQIRSGKVIPLRAPNSK